MLKSGKELKVFSVKQEDFKKFTEEAKRYGVLYSALINKKAKDGVIDILVKAEDASKINRIVQRFDLAKFDEVAIRGEIQKTKEKKAKTKGVQTKTVEDRIKDEIKNIKPPFGKDRKKPSVKAFLERARDFRQG